MYITQEAPIIKDKLIYFVGASHLNISIENEITDLTLTLKGFLHSLKNYEPILSSLSENELELLYNKVYQTLQDFSFIHHKMNENQYFENITIQEYFDKILLALKELRAVLLKQIEGDLVLGLKQVSQNNVMKSLNKQ